MSRAGSAAADGSAVDCWRRAREYNQPHVPPPTQIRIQPTSITNHGVRVTTQHSNVPATINPALTRHAQSTHGGGWVGGTGGSSRFGPLPYPVRSSPVRPRSQADHGESSSTQ